MEEKEKVTKNSKRKKERKKRKKKERKKEGKQGKKRRKTVCKKDKETMFCIKNKKEAIHKLFPWTSHLESLVKLPPTCEWYETASGGEGPVQEICWVCCLHYQVHLSRVCNNS